MQKEGGGKYISLEILHKVSLEIFKKLLGLVRKATYLLIPVLDSPCHIIPTLPPLIPSDLGN